MISLPLLPSSPLPNYLSFPGTWTGGDQPDSQERPCLPTTWQVTVKDFKFHKTTDHLHHFYTICHEEALVKTLQQT